MHVFKGIQVHVINGYIYYMTTGTRVYMSFLRRYKCAYIHVAVTGRKRTLGPIPYLESCDLKLQFNIASGYHKLFDG